MITVRPAKDTDLPSMLDIYNDVIVHTTAVYDYEPHSLSMRKAWFDAKMKDNYPVFVAKDGEDLVGFSSFGLFRSWAAYQFTVENSVYVATGQRGKGVGKLLLKPLIEAAKERKMHAMIAGIDATNEASIRLHCSLGFSQVAHFKEVGYKFGHWLDLIFMELLLK